MAIDEVGYNRKDIKTNLGYIFNVPYYFELNTSEMENLFGIIEIPFDLFLNNDDKQRGGNTNPPTRSNLPGILYYLIGYLLGRTGGRPTIQQTANRNDIIQDFRNLLISLHLPVSVNLKVSEHINNGGLIIYFSSNDTRNILRPFHITVHDRGEQWGSQTVINSRVHSTENLRNVGTTDRPAYIPLFLSYSSRVVNERRQLNFNLRHHTNTVTSSVNRDENVQLIVDEALTILNDRIFNHTIYQVNTSIPISETNITLIQPQPVVDTNSLSEFPSLGGRRVKNKKTKKARKNKKTKKSKKSKKTRKTVRKKRS